MCEDQANAEARKYFAERFAADLSDLVRLRFIERGGDIWATTAFPTLDLAFSKTPGLRALRRTPHGLKPTSAFLTLLGPRLHRSVASLDTDSLRQLLMGRQIETNLTDGFIALKLGDDILGCGRAFGGQITALIPTGRRRELLDALDLRPARNANL